MLAQKADIILQLQKEILQLQGFRNKASDDFIRPVLGSIDSSFPNGIFPLATIHEFLTQSSEDIAATSGFVSCLLSSLMSKGGVSVWIGSSQEIFPVALKFFNVEPDKIIFINTKKQKELLWLIEETLKCEGLAAVVGEVKEISFTASRRLQLAVEQSRVTGFLIRQQPRILNTIACISRWRITSLPGDLMDGMPGVGFPRWHVELLKVGTANPVYGKWNFLQTSCRRLKKIIFPFSGKKDEKQDKCKRDLLPYGFVI